MEISLEKLRELSVKVEEWGCRYDIEKAVYEDFLKELMRLGRLQKHLFVEGKRTGDKEYAEVLVAITELANTLRRNLMGR